MSRRRKAKRSGSSGASTGGLLGQLRDTMRTAETHARSLRRANRRLVVISLVASVLATTLAGVTAASGPLPLAQTTGSSWRIVCGAVAVLSAAAAIASGLQQRMAISEQYASALSCAAKLRRLEIQLASKARTEQEVAGEFADVVAEHKGVVVGE